MDIGFENFFFSEVECSQGTYLFSEAVVFFFFFFLNPGFFSFPKLGDKGNAMKFLKQNQKQSSYEEQIL